jgi:rubrerythrin
MPKNEVKKMDYLSLLQKALVEEIEATRLYLACMALSPSEDIQVLLEINKDETDHIALISSLISQQIGEDINYAKMVPGVD